MTRPRALFVDFYGTLVEPDEGILFQIAEKITGEPMPGEAPKEFLAQWNKAYLRAIAKSNTGAFILQTRMAADTLRETLAATGYTPESDPDSLCVALTDFWRRPPRMDGVEAFLDWLPVPTVVVSNIDGADLDAALEHLGWRDRFADIVTSEEVRAYKPDARMFERALHHTGAKPGEVVHIGDSWSGDIVGAGALGIPTVWMNRHRRETRNGGETLAAVVSTPGELPETLERISD